MAEYSWLIDDIETLSTYTKDGYTKAVLNQSVKAIRKLSADVQHVRHGRWKFIADKSWHGGGKYERSACKYGYAIEAYHEPDEFTYCPHCGAKMDGGDTSERQTMAFQSQND